MTDWDPDDLKNRFITAMSESGTALQPLIDSLRREGRDPQPAIDQQAELWNQSTRANAIAVEQILAAAKDDMNTLSGITKSMKADAERLAKSEANVARFIAIATSCTKVVDALCPFGSLATLGSNLVALQSALGGA